MTLPADPTRALYRDITNLEDGFVIVEHLMRDPRYEAPTLKERQDRMYALLESARVSNAQDHAESHLEIAAGAGWLCLALKIMREPREFELGARISDACDDLLEEARDKNRRVYGEFNGVVFYASPDDDNRVEVWNRWSSGSRS